MSYRVCAMVCWKRAESGLLQGLNLKFGNYLLVFTRVFD
jgi:hypothetical protein